MNFIEILKNQKMQMLSFVISIFVVAGSFAAGWLLTVLTPLFVFLIFKFLKVWRNRERLAYGLAAIIIGTMLFFFIFSHEVANVDTQKFGRGNLTVKITGYSSTDFNKPAVVDVIYKGKVNTTLYYEVNRTTDGSMVKSGYVNGTVQNGETHYHFTLNVTEGIYYVKIVVNKDVVYGEVLRETPDNLFVNFIKFSGLYVIGILGVLYSLFIFGVYMIRKNQELMALRYEPKK